MNVDVAAVSDTGRVRKANEDSFLVDLDLFVFAVADGMGGHVAGEIASATAIEAVRACVANGTGIENAIKSAHSSVKKKASSEEELAGMGTTMTAMGFTKENQLVIAHVGDSRAYVLHRQLLDDVDENSQTELVRITKDHSLVEELVDAGQITEEEANVHPRRSVITRALGIDGEVEVDTTPIPFLKGDRYILCSDGLTSMVRDDEITQVVRLEKSPNDCARELVARANKAGGADNITVLVIGVIDPDLKAPIMTAAAQSIPASDQDKNLVNKKGRIGFGLRIIVSIALICGLLFGTYSTAKHFAHQGFFLDQKNGQVVLMSGRYGGILWWDPEINTQTGIEIKNLSSADKLLVTRHETYSSRKEALARLEQIRNRQVDPSTVEEDTDQSTTSSSTTTSKSNTANTSKISPITISEGTSVSTEE